MRSLMAVPFLILAAYSGGGEDSAGDGKAKAEAAKALELASGQWQIATEVTQFSTEDDGAPKIDTPVGTRQETAACVAAGEGKRPAPALLSGHPDYSCQYGNFYMSSGTLNAQLTCTREGLSGEVRMTVDGTYTSDTIEANQSVSTFLAGTGDVTLQTRLTGRHVGPTCAPAATETKDS